MARNFSTTADCVQIGAAAIPALTFTGASFSLACWATLTGGSGQRILLNEGGAYRLKLDGSSHLELTIGSSGCVGATIIPANGAWYHFCGAYSAPTTTGLAYVNGVQDGSATTVPAATSTTSPLAIGQTQATGGNSPWVGAIAEVGIWNRVLTPAEVAALATGVPAPVAAPSGLVGYWPLHGVSTTEPDLSGQGNNGTVSGTTVAAPPPVGPLVRPRGDFWAMRSAAAAYAQTLGATQATVPALTKQPAKLLSASQPTAPSLTKQPAKLLLVTQATSASLGKQAGKALSAAQATSATLTKQVGKLLGPLSQATTASLQAIKTHLLSLSAVQPTTATLGKGTAKALGATQPTTPLLTKGAAKALSVAQATLATLQPLKTHLLTLSAVQATSATLGRAVGKGLAATQGTAATLTKGAAKPLALVQPTSPTLTKGAGKLLALAQPTTAVLSRGAAKALLVTQPTSASLVKGVGKALAATQGTVASLVARGSGAVTASVATLYARAQAWVLKVRALVFGQPPSYALSPGPIVQSHLETKTRTADFTAALPGGSTTVSGPVGYLIRTDTGADVTSASLTVGSPSGATVPFTLTALSPGVQYRLNLVVQAAGNTITGEATVVCPD